MTLSEFTWPLLVRNPTCVGGIVKPAPFFWWRHFAKRHSKEGRGRCMKMKTCMPFSSLSRYWHPLTWNLKKNEGNALVSHPAFSERKSQQICQNFLLTIGGDHGTLERHQTEPSSRLVGSTVGGLDVLLFYFQLLSALVQQNNDVHRGKTWLVSLFLLLFYCENVHFLFAVGISFLVYFFSVLVFFCGSSSQRELLLRSSCACSCVW